MKNVLKSIGLLLCLSLWIPNLASAQKIGHLNSGNLLELLPETKAAGKSLETFQEQLGKSLQTEIDAFETKVKAFYDPNSRQNKTPIQIQKEEAELAQEEQVLIKKRQENEQKVLEKRQELLKPIFERIDKAVHDVAKEQGYQMIFDSSVFNVILYKEDADDILNAVKAKLGL